VSQLTIDVLSGDALVIKL